MNDELTGKIDGLIGKTWDELREAANTKDSSALHSLNGRMAELNKLKKDLQLILDRIREIGEPGNATGDRNAIGLRKIRIRVTQGMINQNLLTLTDALRQGIVRTRETFTIETFPNRRKFQTFLERVGNKLQERGAIAAFYRTANIQAEEIVEMTEVSAGSWQLKPADAGHQVPAHA